MRSEAAIFDRCAELGIARDRPLAARRAAPRARARTSRGARRDRTQRTTRPRPRSRSRGCSASARTSSRSPAPAARRRRARPPAPPSLQLDDDERVRLGRARALAPSPRRATATSSLVMGIPGAGKSRVAAEYVARGYVRLNRDERGGTLRELADALDEALAAGAREVVLDNTYLTRAARSYVVEAAARHGAPVRCVWLDTPLAQAQVNLVERLLERFGALPTPEELKEAARTEPGVLSPTPQMRALRELEPPADDEGFAAVERVPFARTPTRRAAAGGVFVAAAAVGRPGWDETLAGGLPECAASRVRLEPRRHARRSRRSGSGCRRRRDGTGRSCDLPAPRRPADLLVPPAAARPPLAFARRHGSIPRARSSSGRPRRIARSRPLSAQSQWLAGSHQPKLSQVFLRKP